MFKRPSAPPSLTTDIERDNVRHLYVELALLSVSFAMEWYYLGVVAVRFGATPLLMGVLVAARSALLTLGSYLSTRWAQRFPNLMAALRGPALYWRVLAYGGVIIATLLTAYQPEVLAVFVILSAIPQGIAQGVFLGVLPQAVSHKNLATVVARRSALMNGIVLVFVFILGQLMEWLPMPTNYQIGFMLALVMAVIGWGRAQRVRIPDTPQVERDRKQINVWAHRPYRMFAIVVLAANMSVFLSAPMGQLWLVRGLNASDSWISVFGVAEMGAGALFTLILARLVARFGEKPLIVLTLLGTAANALILGLTPTLPPVLIGSALFGAGWFSVNVLLYNHLVAVVPRTDMARYATNYQILINASLFIGPLLGTLLIENVMTIPAALVLAGVLRAGAALLALFLLTKPQPAAEEVSAGEARPATLAVAEAEGVTP